LKELENITGKHIVEDAINFFGFIIKFKARLVKDEESVKPRFLLDEENMGFEIEATPKNEPEPTLDRIEELARVVEASARKAVKKMNA
jgi:hypothetical protein